jgi:hypothetical protein
MRPLSHRHVPLLLLLSLAGLGLILVSPAAARQEVAPRLQPTPFLTPTPGPDGRIVYVVQKDDNLWTIAAIAGISVNELMALNGLQSGDVIIPGMQLELGLGGPVEPTPGPGASPSPSPAPLTPTPIFGTGEICVVLFLDQNGNARLDEQEGPLAGGQVSVADLSGALAGEHSTDDNPDGYCFQDLEFGDYNVSAAAPPDHNPTTAMNLPVRLEPGDTKYVEFGAQPSAAIGGGPGQNGGDRSTLLGLLGVLLLLAAGGLGYVASRYRRRTPMSLR